MSKYDTDTEETKYQVGSGELVLKNKLGITNLAEMDEVESALLLKLYEKLFLHSPARETLDFTVLLGWHQQWLGNLYSWAGKIRSVNIAKGGFHFASAAQLERLIDTFEHQFLTKYVDVERMEREEFVEFLAQSHTEFILIHPFREGNGRISRLLIDVLAVKAGYGLLDYFLWDQNKDFYFRSIQAGIMGEYQHLTRLISDTLPNT